MKTTRSLRGARRGTVVIALTAAAVLLSGCAASPHAGDSSSSTTTASTSVVSVKPATSSVTATRTVTIAGTGLSQVKTVDFGSARAKVTAVGNSSVKVEAPAASGYAAGSVPIVLRDASGKVIARKADSYSYAVRSGVDKQLQYALTYWKNYNTAQYGDLNSVGGDCANFVSQTLIARGWAMNDDWYNHDAAGEWSPAWGYVPAMDDYFAQNASALGLQELSFAQRSSVALGDIAIFDWDGDGSPDHVQVVTGIKKVGNVIHIEMASHNDDYDYRDLDQEVTQQHPGATGHFWHLTR